MKLEQTSLMIREQKPFVHENPLLSISHEGTVTLAHQMGSVQLSMSSSRL
jgi:hypothetical protein